MHDWGCAVEAGTLAAFDAAAVRLGEGLRLDGLMDVEVMVGGGEPKVLEIDARLPSQTPTAVLLVERHQHRRRAAPHRDPRRACGSRSRAPRRACVYEHVHAHAGLLEVIGEHVMGSARPLTLVPGFFGAAEALTDYRPGASTWSATLIGTGASVDEAMQLLEEAVSTMAARREA